MEGCFDDVAHVCSPFPLCLRGLVPAATYTQIQPHSLIQQQQQIHLQQKQVVIQQQIAIHHQQQFPHRQSQLLHTATHLQLAQQQQQQQQQQATTLTAPQPPPGPPTQPVPPSPSQQPAQTLVVQPMLQSSPQSLPPAPPAQDNCMRNKGIVHLSPGRRRCRQGQPGDWSQTDHKAVLLGNPLTMGAGTTMHLVTLSSRFGGVGKEEFSNVSSLPKENSKTTFECIPPNICPFFEKQLKFLPLGPTLCSLALLEIEK